MRVDGCITLKSSHNRYTLASLNVQTKYSPEALAVVIKGELDRIQSQLRCSQGAEIFGFIAHNQWSDSWCDSWCDLWCDLWCDSWCDSWSFDFYFNDPCILLPSLPPILLPSLPPSHTSTLTPSHPSTLTPSHTSPLTPSLRSGSCKGCYPPSLPQERLM